MTLPTSRASPSMLSPRMYGVMPTARATWAAASSAICGVVIKCVSVRASRVSPGLIDSPRPLSSTVMALGGKFMPYRFTKASASPQVVGSATVGPEAISTGLSSGTSEMSKLMTRAGWQAAARRPPLIAER